MKTTNKTVYELPIQMFMTTMMANGLQTAFSLFFENKKNAKEFYRTFLRLEREVLAEMGQFEGQISDTEHVLTHDRKCIHFNNLIPNLHMLTLIDYSIDRKDEGLDVCKWKFYYLDVIALEIEIESVLLLEEDGLKTGSGGMIKVYSLINIDNTIDDLLNGTGVSPSE